MGRYVVNGIEEYHGSGVNRRVSLRLHFGEPAEGDPWDTQSAEIAVADWLAELPGAAASVTAAGAAVATCFPAWWSSLTAPQRDAIASEVYAHASELAAAFAA